jgi:S1-C subfamily serine protease
VGINSQILSPSGGNIGIGFAIPANMASTVMQALIADGQVRRGMLGVTVQGVTPDIAKSLKLEDVSGALVSDVRAGSAADEAGVQRGDVITALTGERVVDSNALRNHVARLKPGSRVELTVIRDGRTRTLTATLDELPSQNADANAGAGAPANASLGLSVQPLTGEHAARLGVPRGEGLLVTGVAASSAAADAGIQRGDVILEVDGTTPTSPSDLRSASEDAGERPMLVLVRRGDATLYLTLDARS